METQNINKAEVTQKLKFKFKMYLSMENQQRNILIEVYRNHRIGFIFQNYNLIPHQTVFRIYRITLTISGISKAEKIERDENTLDRVDLHNKYNMHPNQLHLSGGQCQIVEIASALIINLEIIFGYNIFHLFF